MRRLCLVAVVVALAVPSVASAGTVPFSYTGSEQTFVVPAGVASIAVSAIGGGAFNAEGGKAAVVTGSLSVTPGATLYVEVGGPGGEFGGGFNGGGSGGGIGGGGASDVRTLPRTSPSTLSSRLLVAAAGGAIGASSAGGDADASSAVDGHSGAPGTTAGGGGGGNGGAGGCSGSPGALGQGGNGCLLSSAFGGGGGGGLYGGGGGGVLSDHSGGGGGGGSSLVPAGGTRALTATAQGDDGVTITFQPSTTPPGTGGGTGSGTTPKDKTAPTIRIFTLTPTSFVAANIGPATLAKTVGTRIVFKLSENATVKFAAARKTAGHKKKVGKKRKCVTGGRKHGKCTLYKRVKGSFSFQGKPGLNTLRFTGRIGGKTLSPGNYRLTAVATDAAANKSKTLTKSFTIKKP